MIPRMIRCAAVPAIVSAYAVAAEVRVADLAVVAETRPTAINWRWDDRLGSRQGSGSLDSSAAAGLGVRWGWGSPGRPHLATASADLLWERSAWDGAVIEGPMLRLGAGYAWAASDRWLVLAGPMAAVGRQRLARDSAESGALSMAGRAVQAGIAAGLRCSLDRHWSVGADAGWQAGWVRLAGDGAALAIDAAGTRVGLSLAYTLDPRPRPLE